MTTTCRSSGIQSSSAIVHSGRCKLISIHAQFTGSNPTTIRVFDNASAASGTELARIVFENPAERVEYDMHGVIAHNGLFLDISTGAGTGAAVSVEFA